MAAIWNESVMGRGSYVLRAVAPLERCLFGKLYFDPAGLILAYEGDAPVGFAHCGFGPSDDGADVNPATGVICTLVIRPSFRRRGCGTELLNRAEQYLQSHGATTILAGPGRPNNPFTLGLYGGCDSPGFLLSDPLAGPFFEKRGYTVARKTLVMHRRLDRPLTISDPRFAALRKRYEVVIQPRLILGTWWLENVVGPLEPVEIRVEDRADRSIIGRAMIWEMEGFSWRWNVPAAGLLELLVRDDMRRLGLGRFFLAHVVRYLQEQYFNICECQVHEADSASRSLVESMGFERVDEGRVYSKV